MEDPPNANLAIELCGASDLLYITGLPKNISNPQTQRHLSGGVVCSII